MKQQAKMPKNFDFIYNQKSQKDRSKSRKKKCRKRK